MGLYCRTGDIVLALCNGGIRQSKADDQSADHLTEEKMVKLGVLCFIALMATIGVMYVIVVVKGEDDD